MSWPRWPPIKMILRSIREVVRGTEGFRYGAAYDAKKKKGQTCMKKTMSTNKPELFSPQLPHGPPRFHLPAFNSHLVVRFIYHRTHLLVHFQLPSASPLSIPVCQSAFNPSCQRILHLQAFNSSSQLVSHADMSRTEQTAQDQQRHQKPDC